MGGGGVGHRGDAFVKMKEVLLVFFLICFLIISLAS